MILMTLVGQNRKNLRLRHHAIPLTVPLEILGVVVMAAVVVDQVAMEELSHHLLKGIPQEAEPMVAMK